MIAHHDPDQQDRSPQRRTHPEHTASHGVVPSGSASPTDPAPPEPSTCPTGDRPRFCLLRSAALDWVLIAKEALDNAQAVLEREALP